MRGHVRIEIDGDGNLEGYHDLYHPDQELIDIELGDIMDVLIENAIEDKDLSPDTEYLLIFEHNYEVSIDFEGNKDYDSWIEVTNLVELAKLNEIKVGEDYEYIFKYGI